MGHGQVTLTANTCSRLAPELLADVADRMDAVFESVR